MNGIYIYALYTDAYTLKYTRIGSTFSLPLYEIAKINILNYGLL